MEEQKYLVAIALAEQNKKRIMPLGGKTFAGVDSLNQVPKKEAEKILLDLLLRLFIRSAKGNLKLSNDEESLILIEISFEDMQSKLPRIKSNWLNTGNTRDLFEEFNSICSNIWSIQYIKHEGIIFKELKQTKLS